MDLDHYSSVREFCASLNGRILDRSITIYN